MTTSNRSAFSRGQRRHSPANVAVSLLLTIGILAPGTGFGQSQEVAGEASSSQTAAVERPLSLAAIEACPKQAGPKTLCGLEVHLENRGSQPAFSLVFEVTLNGQALPVYEKQVYMVEVPPTSQTPFKLSLYNFWTSETGRPAPTNGVLEVAVRLIEAQWLGITHEQSEGGEATTEVWTPQGAVPGLPIELETTVTLAKQ